MPASSVQPAPNTFPMARIACADFGESLKSNCTDVGIAFLEIARVPHLGA